MGIAVILAAPGQRSRRLLRLAPGLAHSENPFESTPQGAGSGEDGASRAAAPVAGLMGWLACAPFVTPGAGSAVLLPWAGAAGSAVLLPWAGAASSAVLLPRAGAAGSVS
ncbi:MAG TPA: hypothetical protein VF469_26890, partial [Kofleriaceae bacterium]